MAYSWNMIAVVLFPMDRTDDRIWLVVLCPTLMVSNQFCPPKASPVISFVVLYLLPFVVRRKILERVWYMAAQISEWNSCRKLSSGVLWLVVGVCHLLVRVSRWDTMAG